MDCFKRDLGSRRQIFAYRAVNCQIQACRAAGRVKAAGVTQRSVNAEHLTNLTARPLFTASFALKYSSVEGKTNFLLPHTLNRH